MDITIAEELLLLAHGEEEGTALIDATRLDAALAGAFLAELALMGRLGVDGGKVTVLDPTALGDEQLDAVLAFVSGSQPRPPDFWLSRLAHPKPRLSLLARLAGRGVLSEERGRVLGLFRTERYPELDPRVERDIRRRVRDVLDGAEGDERVVTLISLTRACGLDRKVFPDVPESRIREVSEGEWAGAAVAATIASINVALGVALGVPFFNNG